MRLLLWIVGLASVLAPSWAAGPASTTDAAGAPTFHRDVLPILQAHCQDCHRAVGNSNSGMVAPMALTSYDEARPWAKSIARAVSAGEMPPWYAAPEFHGVFEGERGLTPEQVTTLVAWAKAGGPAGDVAEAPPPRVFPSAEGWTLGEPDLVVKLPEPFWVADEVEDTQPSFELVLTREQLPEDRWIRWIEFRPGNPQIVHHGGARVVPLGADGKPVVDPLCGGKLIGTAPGDGPDVWPVGYGKLVRRGAKLVFNIHYHTEPGPGTGAFDQSMLAIKWHTEPVRHVVRSAGIASRGWEIPPGRSNWRVGAAHTFGEDSYVINMMPHMHTRGARARYELVYPDERREVILEVPRYNYNWQLTYTFKQPKLVPGGTRLEVSMWFDNSSGNVHLIESPDRAVGFGSMTVDEMNIGWTEYANARPITDLEHHGLAAAPALDDID